MIDTRESNCTQTRTARRHVSGKVPHDAAVALHESEIAGHTLQQKSDDGQLLFDIKKTFCNNMLRHTHDPTDHWHHLKRLMTTNVNSKENIDHNTQGQIGMENDGRTNMDTPANQSLWMTHSRSSRVQTANRHANSRACGYHLHRLTCSRSAWTRNMYKCNMYKCPIHRSALYNL